MLGNVHQKIHQHISCCLGHFCIVLCIFHFCIVFIVAESHVICEQCIFEFKLGYVLCIPLILVFVGYGVTYAAVVQP